jgi:hypothetical protein
MLQGHVHFAAERCAHCGCHLRWVPRPETVQRQRLTAFRLAKLEMCPDLTHWERKFVASISHRPRFSPKQQQIIKQLVRQYLEAKAS